MQQLHPRAVWLFFFKYTIPIGIVLLFFLGPAVPLLILNIIFGEGKLSSSVLLFALIVIIFLMLAIPLALIYLWARLTYRYYRYELREDGFRKERGVIWKRYTTIPYERIQNVDIYRGLLARILGLSDLHIQTAGFSGSGGRLGGGSEGRLPGLDPQVAEQLRDELVRRARGSKSQGL